MPVISFILAGLSVLATAIPDLGAQWVLEREAVAAGEWWRLLTCHFVHFGPAHMIYNLIALGAAGWLVERRSRPGFVLLSILTAPAIGFWLLSSVPDMARYGGMSGMACGLLFYGALTVWLDAGPWKSIGLWMAMLLPAKVAFEFFHQASLLPYGTQPSFVAMPESHATGLAVALILFIFTRSIEKNVVRTKGDQGRACALTQN